MTLYNPCIKSIGPPNARIAFVGEAPGEQEERTGIPFIGAAGQKFDAMLEVAGLKRSEIYLTNLLFTRPPGNKLDAFLVSKSSLPAGYSLPSLRQGKYLHPDLLPELERLHSELAALKPNLIVTGGGSATWGLLGNGAITKIRGTVHASKWGKVLPTLHPATVLYDWSNRPIIIADLMKAKVECEFPEIRRPRRFILIDPTVSEIIHWFDTALSKILSVDVETRNGTITCVGFSDSPSSALVVPFFDTRKPDKCYWTRVEELEVRKIINQVLSSEVPKLFQNGLYDLQYLLREGFQVRNCLHDTMILHHAIFPELPKGLGFMGSIYTNEASWKLMRQRGKEEFKKDE